MNKITFFIACLSAGWLYCGSASAQQTVSGGGLQFSEDQKLMLEAAGKTVNHDYKGAEALYSRAISLNGSNMNAYVQRGIVRRELHDAAGTASDGRMAVTLANAALRNNPNDPNLYYQRGMGFRLLKNFNQARQDITNGMRMGGPSSWETDIQAIDFEEKEAAGQ